MQESKVHTYTMNAEEIAEHKKTGQLPFVRLQGVNTTTAIATDEMKANIDKSIKRGLPKLQSLSEFQKVKGHNKPIALVGGGPSLKDHLHELKTHKTIMVCGSPNDYIMGHGIVPTYVSVCDPDAVSAKYLTKLDTETKYLIASVCSETVFEALKGYQVLLWHCHSEELGDYVRNIEGADKYEAICGGCTIGLRSLSIAIMMGYSNIHLYGFDSCMSEQNEHHAYEFQEESEKLGLGEQMFPIKLGRNKAQGKTYICAGYQLAQASNFESFYKIYKELFTPTFHGGGLLSDMVNLQFNEAI